MTRRLTLAPLASAALIVAALFAAGAQAAPSPYALDPHHTQITFGWTHFGFSHMSGRFDKVDGTFLFDPAAPAKSKVEVSIPITSISTGVADLDDDLRSDGFFDAGKFPTATFKSTSVKSTGKDKLAVSGDLSIHGVTKPVTLDVTINKIGMHPVGVIFALMAGGELFGFLGILLALPMSAIAMVLLRYVHERYTSSVLYAGPAPKPEAESLIVMIDNVHANDSTELPAPK